MSECNNFYYKILEIIMNSINDTLSKYAATVNKMSL